MDTETSFSVLIRSRYGRSAKTDKLTEAPMILPLQLRSVRFLAAQRAPPHDRKRAAASAAPAIGRSHPEDRQHIPEPGRHARCSKRISMQRLAEEGNNLNIPHDVSTAEAGKEIDLQAVHAGLEAIALKIDEASKRHNTFLVELGLAPLS
jgi:hypothetical protein